MLSVDSAEPLLEFDANELGAGPALTTRVVGSGRISYLGTLPNTPLARSISRWLVPHVSRTAWGAGDTVTVATGRTADATIAFVANWSGEAATITPPVAVRDLETGTRHRRGETIRLGPRAASAFEVEVEVEVEVDRQATTGLNS